MANRTVKDAHSIKGTNPQYLIEKITRTRIYESRYWKEECFALTAELLVDKAMELRFIGGVYGGNVRPAPFLCLVLKMLQIQPDKDIIIEFIKNEDFKYVRALGALYMRIVGTSLDCYKYIEPLYLDYRKLRKINTMGQFEMCHMDEFVDEILREERACDVILPRVQKRHVLEENNQLEPRISALDDDLEEMEEEDPEHRNTGKAPSPERGGQTDWDMTRRSPSPRYRRASSRSPTRRRGHSRERDWERDRGDRDWGERDRGDRDRGENRESRRDRGERESRRDRGERVERSRRSRSKSRERRSGHKHKHGDDGGKRKHHKSKKSKHDHDSRGDRDRKRSSRSGTSKDDLEIQEANRLRASLGLAPLRT